MRKILLLSLVLTASGCATKQFPNTPPLKSEEVSTLDCKGIDKEIDKVKDTQNEIERADQFNVMSFVGVVVDLGIGNRMAKSNAKENAQQRLDQLYALKTQKCK